MKALTRILAACIAVAVIWFAVANPGPVVISFDPLPVLLELPVYLLVFVVFAVGVLVGGSSHWLAAAHRRSTARDNKRRLVVLERELDDIHDQRTPAPPEEPQTKLAAR